MLIVLRFLNPSKACACKLVRLDPDSNVIVFRLLHPSNIYAEIDSNLLLASNVTALSLLHPINTPCAIVDTFEGTLNDVRPQYAKVP